MLTDGGDLVGGGGPWVSDVWVPNDLVSVLAVSELERTMNPTELDNIYDREQYMLRLWNRSLEMSLNFMLPPPPDDDRCMCPLCSQGDE